jgi:methionyl-tRNA formyltransferase
MSSLKIIFAGTPEFGLPCLDALEQSHHELIAIYTQPDRPAGRGRKMQASPIKEWAILHNVPIAQPYNFKDPQQVAELALLEPDLMVVIAYGLILPDSVLTVPRFGCINVHASLLPRWRGASPIQHAILHGDSDSGVAIMQMDKGMDTGAVFTVAQCPIDSTETAGSLHDKLALLSVNPLLATINQIAEGKSCATTQEGDVTYAKKIMKEQAHIDWTQSAHSIDCAIRAFSPWPVAYSLLENEPLRIHRAQPVTFEGGAIPGTVLHLDKNGMLVAAGADALLIEQIQFPGAKVLSVADWLNSGKAQLHVGLVLQ